MMLALPGQAECWAGWQAKVQAALMLATESAAPTPRAAGGGGGLTSALTTAAAAVSAHLDQNARRLRYCAGSGPPEDPIKDCSAVTMPTEHTEERLAVCTHV